MNGGCVLVTVCRLLIAVSSLVADHGHTGFSGGSSRALELGVRVMVHGLGVLVVVLAVAMWGLNSQIRDRTSVSYIAGGFLTTGPPGNSQSQCSLAQVV